MSWILAFAGFALLIILHEAGHFTAAKAVGMRVERFSLFFGKPLVSFRRGETEYGIGPIPLGGYVKISGMNPNEQIPPEVAHRAYYRQPVWKRIVVIMAGPAVNVVLAFLILWVLLAAHGVEKGTRRVDSRDLKPPAAYVLKPGDRVVSVDGAHRNVEEIARAVARHTCAGKPVNGCEATTAAHVVVERDGKRLAFDLRPRYHDGKDGSKGMLIGIRYAIDRNRLSALGAAGRSVSNMWWVTKRSLDVFVHIFQSKDRKQIGSVVGAYEATRQSIQFDAVQALYLLALISLSLAIINLFPFLPLDGGHVFWALAEKLRGRRIPFSVMERASAVGFVLVITLFVIGLSNDIDRLQHGGLGVR